MLRNVYLEGEMASKFGPKFEIEATTPKKVFQCLDGNFPDFKQYMIDCAEKGVNFSVDVGGESIEAPEELLLTLGEGDMIITPIPAGSKSGGFKILAAIAIVAFMWWNPMGWAAGTGLAGGATGASFSTAAFATVGGQMALGLAINLALQGIQQLMAPDPATDSRQDESHLFNGSAQNIVEGDPVPVLYGRLKVPGQPISFEVLNRKFTGASELSIQQAKYWTSRYSRSNFGG